MTGLDTLEQWFRHGDRRPATMAGVVTVQALCAVFFAADVLADWNWHGLTAHNAFEGLVALALTLGVVFGAMEVRRLLDRSKRAQTLVSAASGAFADLIRADFDRWRLTPAEQDVALLALKGFDAGEIAEFRGAAAGTVRAQLARVYAKAGVSNRAQFGALFLDELIETPLLRSRAAMTEAFAKNAGGRRSA